MRHDVVIIGAGTAGAVLAGRLSENPQRRVVLLEAGADYADPDLPDELRYNFGAGPHADYLRTPAGQPLTLLRSQYDWGFTGRSAAGAEPMAVPRGKVTGGSSAINSAGFYRGLPEDYDRWEALGCPGWGYQDVAPFFRKVEAVTDRSHDSHGDRGPISVTYADIDGLHPAQRAFYDACRAAGYPACSDHSEPGQWGVGPASSNAPGGIRFSSAMGYLAEARTRPNLDLRPEWTAHRVIIDRQRAVGVEGTRHGHAETVLGDDIILCAGAIGTPHLLLLSGVGPGEELRNLGIPTVVDAPGVGRNLLDHPKVFVSWHTSPHAPDTTPTRGGVVLRYTAPDSEWFGDLSISFLGGVPARVPLSDPRAASPRPARPDERRSEMSVGLLRPLGAGHLRLQSADQHVQPLLHYAYLDEPENRRRLRSGVRTALALAGSDTMSAFLGPRETPTDAEAESDRSLDAWLGAHLTTWSHSAGTCRMGPDSDPLAVVDAEGRVRGVEGLRVCDASIFPDIVRAPINATVFAVAERLAAIIDGDVA